jgi:hypothetical protein
MNPFAFWLVQQDVENLNELIQVAKKEFTIYIDAKEYPATNEPRDHSLEAFNNQCAEITSGWSKRNENPLELKRIAYAFVLSRMIFLRYLKEKCLTITPKEFLLHQLFNSDAIVPLFFSLLLWAIKLIVAGTSMKLRNMDRFGDFESKCICPTILPWFCAWTSAMALDYICSLVDIERSLLEPLFTDNYRPRILK